MAGNRIMQTTSHRRTIAALVAALATVVLGLRAAPPAGVASLAVTGRSNSTPWVAAAGPVRRRRVGRVDRRQDGRLRRDQPRRRADVRRRPSRSTRRPAKRGSAGSCRHAWRLRQDLDPPIPKSPCSGLPAAKRRRSGRRDLATAAGRSRPPVTLQSAGAAGDRGWPALALDKRGTAHAIWLDHRGLARRPGRRSGSFRAQKGQRPRRRRHGAEVRTVLRRRDRIAVHRTRARDGRVLLLQDGVDRRPRRGAVRRVAARVPGQLPRYRLHGLAGWRPIVRCARARERRRLGDQRLSGRRSGDCRGRARHDPPGVADGGRRLESRGRALLCLDARRPHVHATHAHPDARQPQAVTSADRRRSRAAASSSRGTSSSTDSAPPRHAS